MRARAFGSPPCALTWLLPAQVLRELTTAFPSFVLTSVASAGELNSGGDAPPLAPPPR
jgi:hypothetical protein